MKTNDETHSQIILVNWIKRILGKDIWKATHHSPNGGVRGIVEASQFKLMGVRPGFPDLVTYIKNEKYNGLVVELKVKKRKPTQDQLWWLQTLRNCGFKVYYCNGVKDAQNVYLQYFKSRTIKRNFK